MANCNDKSDFLLIELRKIIRAIDLHSKKLMQKYGITGPQMLLLKMICQPEQRTQITSSYLARQASLSQATITSILDRLSEKNYINRNKSLNDKRKVFISPTQKAYDVIRQCPTLLQEDFVCQFEQLHDWEQTLLLSSLERIAEMMQAKKIDAAPVLTNLDIGQPQEPPSN